MLILVLHGHVYLKFDVLLVDFESLDMDFPSKETIPKPIQIFYAIISLLTEIIEISD